MTTPISRTSQNMCDTQEGLAGAGPNVPDGQSSNATHGEDDGEPDLLNGHKSCDTHRTPAVERLTPQSTKYSSMISSIPTSAGDPTSGPTTYRSTPPLVASLLHTSVRDQAGDGQCDPAEVQRAVAPYVHADHEAVDTQPDHFGVDPTPSESAMGGTSPIGGTPVLVELNSGGHIHPDNEAQARFAAAPTPPEPAMRASMSKHPAPVLADPLLALAAEVLDDIEKVRIANENRLRALTTDKPDKDGVERGFGLTMDDPDVARTAAIVAGFLCTSEVVLNLGIPKEPRRRVGCCLEHDAERNLNKRIKDHPLGPWIKAQKGIGEKQGARLIAALGDPCIRPEMTYSDGRVEPARPRKLSELHAYCGVHVINVPGSQRCPADTQTANAAGDPTSARQSDTVPQIPSAGGTLPLTGHGRCDTHAQPAGGGLVGSDPDQAVHDNQNDSVGVAATKARGQRANWNPTARMRATLVANQIVKVGHGGPHREIYDQGRIKYADATHQTECKRCGPAGKPALIGSPLSDGHQHARARRLVTRAILKDLWREARRIHQLSSSDE
jgi:hypothetical protein